MTDDDDDLLLDEPNPKTFRIFMRTSSDEEVPTGFTSATCTIDATSKSLLTWPKEQSAIDALIKKGLKVCLDITLDLFTLPYTQARHQSAILALDEVRTKLIEPNMAHIEAIILHKMDAPFSSEEVRDIQMDALDLLRNEINPQIPVLILAKCPKNPYSFSRLFSPDRFTLFTLALEDAPCLMTSCAWNHGMCLLGYIGRDLTHFSQRETSCGLLVPRFTSDATCLTPLFTHLAAKGVEFKIISEDMLTTEWEGIEELYLDTSCLQPTTLRMIEGFKASGGVVVDQKEPKRL